MIRRVLVAVVAVAALLVPAMPAAAAPAVHTVDAKAYRVSHGGGMYAYAFYEFASPSGNLRCRVGFSEDSSPWSCYAVRHTWRDPELPALGSGCRRQSGALYALHTGDGFYAVCRASDPAITNRGRTLPVGSRIRVLGVTCLSARSDGRETMRCTGPKRTALAMSSTALRFAQPKGFRG